MIKRITISFAVVCSILLVTASFVQAQSATASGEFTLQGRLTTSAGFAVADGAHTIIATVYAAGSTQIVFTETDNITTSDGIFTVLIGANGESGSKLHIDANSNYELGISVDGQGELSPKISLGGSLKALTADLAANANAVGGFGVSTQDSIKGNTLLVLNGGGKISTSLLDSAVVTSINGASGSVTIQGGGDLSVNTTGNTLSLSFNGSGSGTLNFPFSKTVSVAGTSAFSLTNTLDGSAATFVNAGSGTALDVQSMGGGAISAVAKSSNEAVLQLQNTSASANAQLVTAADASGSVVLGVASNGKTTINSSVADALDVTSSAAGEAALKVTGGLKLVGPAGTGQINIGQTQTVVANAYANANSIILITVNGAGGLAVPLQVLNQGNGTFAVAVINGLAGVAGNVKFSYLIVNQ